MKKAGIATVSIGLTSLFFSSCNRHTESRSLSKQQSITWSSHIAKLIYRECTSCHRPGEAGPFNLLTYRDAVKKGPLIRFVTNTGYMPPWPADPSYSHFIGERILNTYERKQINDWVNSGMPRGDSTIEPRAPDYYLGSFFGKPDLVVRAKEAVKIKGNGTDVFIVQKFPYRLDKDTLVDIVEFVPHRRKLVHHVNGHLISYDANRKFNYQNGSSYHSDTKTELMKVYKDMNIPYTDLKQPMYPTLTPNVVYYLPGYLPPQYPSQVGGYRLKKNGLFLLNNVHYGPSKEDVVDSSYINVFYRKTPLQRSILETQLGTFGLTPVIPKLLIPANEIRTFHTSYTLPQSISLISVNPHMHLIGKSFRAFAVKTNGDTVPLIRINKWDFRWQYYYTYKHPIILEKGTTLFVFGTYDNTTKNPNNPNHPPQTISQGNGVESMKTSEEMFQFIFTFMPYKKGDEEIDLERKQ